MTLNPRLRLLALGCFLAGILLISVGMVGGQSPDDDPFPVPDARDVSPIHPPFELLDAEGNNVLTSNAPLSTMTTCGTCHDTNFIAEHSFHVDVGLSDYNAAGSIENARAWDTSPGYFGRWDPITYRYLSPVDDAIIDLTTAEWVQVFGARHVGGGPAMLARDGTPLVALSPDDDNPETAIIGDDGNLEAWDWSESGTVEMNCFLCHTVNPNNAARLAALQAGDFAWSNTATLAGSGIVAEQDGTWVYNPDAFDVDNRLLPEFITLQDPRSTNCGLCHGEVNIDAQTPVDFVVGEVGWRTLTTGQIVSPQRVNASALNLANKNDLNHAWDIHAERVLDCVDCHYSLNNPIYAIQGENSPEHLVFDPRRLDISEYLYRPLHEFAKGNSAQGILAPQYDNTMRRCESCHSIDASHDWLPYKEGHVAALSCETCHIAQVNAPALQVVDWTVLTSEGDARHTYRGIDAEGLITGYQPILLERQNLDDPDNPTLAPFNLVTAYYWTYGNPTRPVPLRDLQAAWLEGDTYATEVLSAFDADGDGTLSESELHIDTAQKAELIAQRLTDQGLENPQMVSEVLPFSLNHGVVTDEWAIRDCDVCHTDDSWVSQPFELASYTPFGVEPTAADNATVNINGTFDEQGGALFFEPDTPDLYILGHDAVAWVDWLGLLVFLGTLGGVVAHSGVRYMAARNQASHPHDVELKKVYMYSVYERQWHWLQSALIFGLLFTGLIIHKPEMLGFLSFRYIVLVHNVLAAILVINAALAAFYHLASGEIRQYIPRPYGFFDRAFAQTRYYMLGIFKGEGHPLEKTPDQKLNPLQQMTYLAILNILLPAQVITGALMWIAQEFPDITQQAGGLVFLAPIHSLVAWLFATFIVMHVYMTTTGHTPLANIKGMMLGWDEVETQPQSASD